MTQKQKLTSWILSYGKAMATGDANLVNHAIENVNALLKTLPEQWSQEAPEEPKE